MYNAFTWLLTGKDSAGTKGYTPKTNDSQGGEAETATHGLLGDAFDSDYTLLWHEITDAE